MYKYNSQAISIGKNTHCPTDQLKIAELIEFYIQNLFSNTVN